MAEPESCLIAFTADGFSIFPIVDAMRRRGWFVQPQLGYMGSKENIHLSIDQSTIDVVERFLPDLEASIAEAKSQNVEAIPEPMRMMLGAIEAADFTPDSYRQLMAAAGTSDGLPEGTTMINSMLNAMKPEVAAKVMTEFFNDLYVA
jgi:sphinganine-1-phosphate aldolase